MPDLATQAAIAAEMASKRNSCLVAHREATRALALLDRLEQGILARAFRGELVPQDANAESVSDSIEVIETHARTRRRRAA
jgi:type I restriction enzyme S subunit